MKFSKTYDILGASHLQKCFLIFMTLLLAFATLKCRHCIPDVPTNKDHVSLLDFGSQCEFEKDIESDIYHRVHDGTSYPLSKLPRRKQVDDFGSPSTDLYNTVWGTIYPNRSTKCWSCRFGPDVAFKLKVKSVLDAGAGESPA